MATIVIWQVASSTFSEEVIIIHMYISLSVAIFTANQAL